MEIIRSIYLISRNSAFDWERVAALGLRRICLSEFRPFGFD